MRRHNAGGRVLGISLYLLMRNVAIAACAAALVSATAVGQAIAGKVQPLGAGPTPIGPAALTSTTAETPIPTAEGSITLWPRLNLFAWPGPTMPLGQALSGPLMTGGGTLEDIAGVTSAVWGFDAPSQTWRAYFPGASGTPGANDLDELVHGSAYALFVTRTTAWGIATATLTPVTITVSQLPELVQRVASAVETGDAAALPGLIDAIPVPCEAPTTQPGLGSSPECPAGTPAGTPIGAWVLTGACEGGYVSAGAAVDTLLQLAMLHPVLRYVIVPEQPVGGFLQVRTFLVFQREGPFQGMFLGLTSQGIVQINEGCAGNAAQQVTAILMTRLNGVGSTVYAVNGG